MSLIRMYVLLAFVAACGGCATRHERGFEAGSSPERNNDGPDWYTFDWMTDAPNAPSFSVLDTESSLGPYANRTKTITLKDIVKMHGHLCDGLVAAACALSVGLRELYPDGVVDRTDTGGICNNSPCYGDVVAYLTGGRIRFGTQKIDPSLGHAFILYRFSTRQAVKVTLNPGVFPAEVAVLEGKLRTGTFTVDEMRLCQKMQWEYAKMLVSRPLEQSFTVRALPGFVWQSDRYEHLGKRGDIINKDCLKTVVP